MILFITSFINYQKFQNLDGERVGEFAEVFIKFHLSPINKFSPFVKYKQAKLNQWPSAMVIIADLSH